MSKDLELEDNFPMIDVKKMNDTEIRLFALLFNLMKEPKGISFQKFRKIMPRHYRNEDIDSDRKKLYRDLNQLKSMGFNIKMANFGYQSEDHYPYYLEKEKQDQVLKFSKEELEYLSILLCSETNIENQILLSLSQKLFSKNLELYPKGIKIHKHKKSEEPDEEESPLTKIIQALKDKRALVISYGRDNKERIIEPYRLVRKNSEDFYLIAYDRMKKGIRRFIIPRIEIKKDLREDFHSNKKNSDIDLSFHPLSFSKHESEEILIMIDPNYKDSFQLLLDDYPYKEEGQKFILSTTNKEAMFNFFMKYPEALQNGSSLSFTTAFKEYLNSLIRNYSIVT